MCIADAMREPQRWVNTTLGYTMAPEHSFMGPVPSFKHLVRNWLMFLSACTLPDIEPGRCLWLQDTLVDYEKMRQRAVLESLA